MFGGLQESVLCIFEQECAIESFFLWKKCHDLQEGSFVIQILIYRMGFLVQGKIAITNLTMTFLLTILALLHISTRIVTVPYIANPKTSQNWRSAGLLILVDGLIQRL